MNPPVVLFSPLNPDESGASGYASPSDERSDQPGVKENIKQVARDTAGQIKEAATDVATQAKEQGIAVASERKAAVAERIGQAGAAVRDTARSVEAEDPNIAWFTHRAADRLQRAADYVRERDFAELRDDAEAFARRHPVAVLGGAFVAGLIVANLLKAGRRSDTERFEEENRATSPAGSATEPRPRQAAETNIPDDAEHVRESGPVPMGHAAVH